VSVDLEKNFHCFDVLNWSGNATISQGKDAITTPLMILVLFESNLIYLLGSSHQSQAALDEN